MQKFLGLLFVSLMLLFGVHSAHAQYASGVAEIDGWYNAAGLTADAIVSNNSLSKILKAKTGDIDATIDLKNDTYAFLMNESSSPITKAAPVKLRFMVYGEVVETGVAGSSMSFESTSTSGSCGGNNAYAPTPVDQDCYLVNFQPNAVLELNGEATAYCHYSG